MSVAKAYKELQETFSGVSRVNFPIRKVTTLKIGGPAKLLVEADTKEKLIEVLQLIRKLKLPYFVIAGGSNLLFSDKGFDGVVVHYTASGLEFGKTQVKADAGLSLGKLVRELAKKNLGGMDFLANIPGSVGGAVVGNAGCYGKWIGDLVKAVSVWDMKTGKLVKMLPKQLGFSYRNSVCKARSEWVVVDVTVKVKPANKSEVLRAIEAERQERLRKHPQQPSAGSFFKNVDGQATWKLIDGVGLRGKRVGGARISNKHPNFLVNVGGAKAKEVLALVRLVQGAVRRKYHIDLEPEVRVVSEAGVVQ